MGLLSVLAKPAVDAVSGAVGKYFDHEDQKLSARELIEKIAAEPEELQGELDKIAEAQTGWLTHWRDGAGWICVFAMGWQFIVGPITEGIMGAVGITTYDVTLDTGPLVTLLGGMLGLGGMHVYDSAKTAK